VPGSRPKNIGAGETVLYNAHGDVVSIIKNKVRIVTTTYEVVATDIILDGTVRLGGGAGSGVPLRTAAGGATTKVFGT
jgi:hypothetical protein